MKEQVRTQEKDPAKDFARSAEQDRVRAQEKGQEEKKEAPRIERKRGRNGLGC